MLITDAINLKKITPLARENIAKACYDEVFVKIWEGVNYTDFYHMFFSTADSEKIFLFKTTDQKLAGYLIYRVMEIAIEERAFAVGRLSTNVLPHYFGQNLIHRIVFLESSKFFLKNLFTKRTFVLFFTANSPASYCIFKRRSRKVFPCPVLGVPEPFRQLMLDACQRFHIPLDDKVNFVTSYTVRLKQEVVVKMDLSQKNDDIYRFYMKHCPRYHEGQAMVTMKPIYAMDGFIDMAQQIFRLSHIRLEFYRKMFRIWIFGKKP
ncbi:MAG: hypothetical protein ACOH5I_18920 [Oligoflexus sp.]